VTTTTDDLSSRLESLLRVDPAAPVLDGDGRSDSWGDLASVLGALRERLANVPPEAAIGVVTRNRVEIVEALLALLIDRRPVYTLNDMQPDGHLADEIRRDRPAVVVATAQDWERAGLREAAAEAGAVALLARRGPEPGLDVLGERALPAEGHLVLPDDVAVSLKTSGTTGPPKRITLTHRGLSASIEGVRRHHGGKRGADPWRPELKPGVAIQMLSLAHTSALQTVCTTVSEGRRLVLLDRFEPIAWAKAVRDHGVVTSGLPPTAVRMLLDSDVPAEWLSSLRAVRAGSAPLDPQVAADFEARFGTAVLQAYGATEFQGIASWTLKDHRAFREAKRGAVGRVHPGVEVRIVDETDTPVPFGTQGVLEVRTAQSARGGAQAWVRTSDLARTDADGFLWIDGRVDGAINRGGFKIDPEEVVRTLREHPGVRDAAVVAAPDARLGQVPVAAVEPAPGAEPTAAELRDWVRSHLEPYKVPTAVVLVAELPRNAALKPDRQAILALLP